jgi:hypothetical protein
MALAKTPGVVLSTPTFSSALSTTHLNRDHQNAHAQSLAPTRPRTEPSRSRISRLHGRPAALTLTTDPELDAKVRDVVGLYLNPPDKAIVLSIDEKSQVQALDRTAPILPLRPGIPEKQTHDYVRHGTTTLFAALEVATGKVTDACYPRHRNEEFLAFLKQVAKTYPRQQLHIVCDNYGTHKHPNVQAWLDQEPPHHAALHPDLGVVAQPDRDLLRHHHPASHPAWHLHLGQGPHRRDRDLHRRLERTLPSVRLDQDRRRDPHQGQP